MVGSWLLFPKEGIRGHISDDTSDNELVSLFLYLVLICFCHVDLIFKSKSDYYFKFYSRPRGSVHPLHVSI